MPVSRTECRIKPASHLRGPAQQLDLFGDRPRNFNRLRCGFVPFAASSWSRSSRHGPSPDFSYRFLIGSGRAGSARHGGERTGAQLERVVAGAMRPCADLGDISRAPFPGQCAAAVRRKWARANSFW